jgi:prevent-host-death family protein
MTQIAIEDLSAQIAKLVREAQCGDEILFTENNRPVARLVSVPDVPQRRTAGSAKHLPHFMADDFDATPEGFEEYMP